MGWGTTVNVDLYLSREHFQTEWDVDQKIEEETREIEKYKDIIRIILTDPRILVDREEDPVYFISNRLEECWEEIERLYYHLQKLELLKANFSKAEQD